MKKSLLFVLGFLLLFSCLSYGGNEPINKSTLDLQGMCARGAKSFFNDRYPKREYVPGIEDSFSYTNHYNRNLDKCFILVSEHHGSGSGEDTIINDSLLLYDVYEQKELATLSAGPHRLGDKNIPEALFTSSGKLGKKTDFDKFIKSYMEEQETVVVLS